MTNILLGIGRRLALAMMELLTEMVLSPLVWFALFVVTGFLFRDLPVLFCSLELLLFAAMAAIVLWMLRRTDRLSAAVGTVRRGTEAEQAADKVLFRFDLTERLSGMAMALLFPAFCLSFVIIESSLLLWLHHALIVGLLVWHYRLYRRLHRIKKARGYGDDTRLA